MYHNIENTKKKKSFAALHTANYWCNLHYENTHH